MGRRELGNEVKGNGLKGWRECGKRRWIEGIEEMV